MRQQLIESHVVAEIITELSPLYRIVSPSEHILDHGGFLGVLCLMEIGFFDQRSMVEQNLIDRQICS